MAHARGDRVRLTPTVAQRLIKDKAENAWQSRRSEIRLAGAVRHRDLRLAGYRRRRRTVGRPRFSRLLADPRASEGLTLRGPRSAPPRSGRLSIARLGHPIRKSAASGGNSTRKSPYRTGSASARLRLRDVASAAFGMHRV